MYDGKTKEGTDQTIGRISVQDRTGRGGDRPDAGCMTKSMGWGGGGQETHRDPKALR